MWREFAIVQTADRQLFRNANALLIAIYQSTCCGGRAAKNDGVGWCFKLHQCLDCGSTTNIAVSDIKVALIDGAITVDSFDNPRRFAADVENLLPRVKLIFDDTITADFADMHVVVTVTLRDGKRLTKKLKELSGFVGFPLSREQRVAKFESCARRVISHEAANEVLARVERLDTEPGVNAIMELVRGTGALLTRQ